MLRISRLTDYAFILLAELAEAEEGEVLSGSTLAERTPLPLPTVRKVLKKLGQEGLLESHQGAHGGYALTRSADEVSVTEVISAMEGPIAVTTCTDADEVCEIEEACPTSESWKVINEAIRATLDELTLADLHGPDTETVQAALSRAGSSGSAPSPGGRSPDDPPRRSNP
ncbi:SUF system Fe-S cluster assembly regulator [Thermoplasmatales archaeon SW_10_69_26]|nr:MAG: SUF system Fe-S cluster assembly regulator [Thermoplasmatales archaeon SW_10_69_26]